MHYLSATYFNVTLWTLTTVLPTLCVGAFARMFPKMEVERQERRRIKERERATSVDSRYFRFFVFSNSLPPLLDPPPRPLGPPQRLKTPLPPSLLITSFISASTDADRLLRRTDYYVGAVIAVYPIITSVLG